MSSIASRLGLPDDRGPRVLAIGAHADDIEIGCGGTVARLLQERPDTRLTWVVLSAPGARAQEASASAMRLLGAVGGRVEIRDHRDGYLAYEGAAVKDTLRMLELTDPAPDLVLAHRRVDAHQDHRLVADLAWQLFRRSTILEYEIPKWDGDLGSPNVYVPLTREEADRKVAHILDCFPSQRDHDWFQADTFQSLMRLRGAECRASGNFAEAFVCRKLVV